MKKTISGRLLAWYDVHGRVLPFRGTKDPYRIWVSEIMLQQTRTETAGGYFLRFMARFPDVFALAEADEQEVLKLWEGLGYYSRARNLHKAAKTVAGAWQGVFPADEARLLSLPGVGEYTAAAIASIAFDLPCPAMDGNLTRVLSRVHGVREDVGIPSVKKRLAALAKEDMPQKRCGDFNQALMDLGASVCCPGTPECEKCPLLCLCDAGRAGDADMLPVKAVQKPPVEEEMAVLIITCRNKVLLHQRREALLKNMWVFPLAGDVETQADAAQAMAKMGLKQISIRTLCRAKHVFTHRIWQMQLWHIEAAETNEKSGPWFTLEEMGALPIPTAVKAARAAAEEILAPEAAFVSLGEEPALLPAAARAYYESWQAAHRGHASPAFLQEHSPAMKEMLLASHQAGGREVFAVQAGGITAGVLVLDGRENEIGLLYIAPAFQGRGLGTKAVQFAIGRLDAGREMKVTAVDHSPHAVAMYKKAGFVQVKAHRLLNKAYDVWETTLVRPVKSR